MTYQKLALNISLGHNKDDIGSQTKASLAVNSTEHVMHEESVSNNHTTTAATDDLHGQHVEITSDFESVPNVSVIVLI